MLSSKLNNIINSQTLFCFLVYLDLDLDLDFFGLIKYSARVQIRSEIRIIRTKYR